MGAVAQVNNNRHGKAALAQTSFGGFVPKGGSPNDSGVLETLCRTRRLRCVGRSMATQASLAKWHHHPHIEIHLIREGTGIDDGGQCRCSV